MQHKKNVTHLCIIKQIFHSINTCNTSLIIHKNEISGAAPLWPHMPLKFPLQLLMFPSLLNTSGVKHIQVSFVCFFLWFYSCLFVQFLQYWALGLGPPEFSAWLSWVRTTVEPNLEPCLLECDTLCQRGGSEIGSIGSSYRGPGLNLQHLHSAHNCPHSNLKGSDTLSWPSVHTVHIWYTDAHPG